MQRTRFWIPIAGLALFGCTEGPPAPRHHRSAQTFPSVRDENAHAETWRAREEIAHEERVPVAGHDDPMATSTEMAAPLERRLRDKLGDDWRIERMGDRLVAIRQKMKPTDDKLMRKVNDEIKSVRDDHKGVMVRHRGSEVMLRGTVDDCKDAAKDADKFAKIDGINRIVVDMLCDGK